MSRLSRLKMGIDLGLVIGSIGEELRIILAIRKER